MQVYVHIAGNNHGPYSIDQVRQYVQAGNFKDDHLACYDGTNWVKIKDVPRFALEASAEVHGMGSAGKVGGVSESSRISSSSFSISERSI
jgi:hypothetical protein